MGTKRPRGDVLTGGTRDVNPQLLGGNVVMSAANTFTQAEIDVPVLRVGFTNAKAQVIEVLGVWFNYSGEDLDAAAESFRMQLCTSSQAAMLGFSSGQNIVPQVQVQNNLLTSGASATENVYYRDMSDGDGHGVIVAVPTIFLGMTSTGLGAAAAGNIMMKYRFKNVPLTEFVGLSIAQSS